MRRSRPRATTRAAQRSALSRALMLLTLVAFALQGFVTQTHIHIVSTAKPAAIDLFDGKPAKNAPAKNDESNCPLCQAFASAGTFVTPAVGAVLPPHVTISIIPLVPIGASLLRTVTHSWQGRAPPLD